jgi:hypothetical protein
MARPITELMNGELEIFFDKLRLGAELPSSRQAISNW